MLSAASSRQRLLCVLAALALGGCIHPVAERVEAVVGDLASQPLDVQIPPTPEVEKTTAQTDSSSAARNESAGEARRGKKSSELRPVSWQKREEATQPPGDQTRPGQPLFEKRLTMPLGLPGGNPNLQLPGPGAPKEVREAARRKLFPLLPTVPPPPAARPGSEGRPLTLADLEKMAMANSPLIRQAASDVEAARGAAQQAGVYPNPNVGYEADNVGTGRTAGYQGFFIEQIIKTFGKLKTAQASALMSLQNAQIALRRAQTDLMAQVRSGYFAVLVARYAMEVNEGLNHHTAAVYEVSRDRTIGGTDMPYQTMALRALAMQVQGSLVQAQDRYLSAWRQLAATLGIPNLPLTELAGSVDWPVPVFTHDQVLAQVLSNHTDILTARVGVQKARYDLHLQQITPLPDVDARLTVQKDNTTPPFDVAYNVQIGVPLPIWDRNTGNIKQAQSALYRANKEEHRVQDDLTTRVADAFERYENNRVLTDYYRQEILPNWKRVYNLVLSVLGLSEAGAQPGAQPNVGLTLGFLDLSTNQQNYVTAVGAYLTALAAQWQAVVDIANLLQSDDLFLGIEGARPAPLLDLTRLPPLPCGQPCSPPPPPPVPPAAGAQFLPMPAQEKK
jgi:cobalt-zinc-cadmium efflux system outer membrane protein